MYWSYLYDSKNPNSQTLTFESTDEFECKKLAQSYCELIMDKFFSGFSNDYDTIFISEFGPSSNPLEKKKEFSIKFNDFAKAKEFLNSY